MARTIVTIVLRSAEPVEVRPGRFEHQYEVIENVPANEVNTPSMGFADTQSLAANSALQQSLSILFANDGTNRYGRITHVVYGSMLYKVASIQPATPRVTIRLGDVAKCTLEELVNNGSSG